MPELERLRADHAPALLAFERANRAYFAASIPDRGDEYFAEFDARHEELLAEQAAGMVHFHVLVDADGDVVGRVNLIDVADGSAELGYRIAESAAGRGLATAAVGRVCSLAATGYGLTELRAATTVDNARSRAVLARTGFVPTGETVLSGRPAITFRCSHRQRALPRRNPTHHRHGPQPREPRRARRRAHARKARRSQRSRCPRRLRPTSPSPRLNPANGSGPSDR